MAKKNQRVFTILGAAVGTGLAAYGIRQGMRWYQRKQHTRRLDATYPESAWPAERRYQPVDQPDQVAIPSTGPLPGTPDMAPPMGGMTTAERVNSDRVSDFDDRGTAFTTTEMDSVRPDELTGDDRTASGGMRGGGAAATRGDNWRGGEFASTGAGDMGGRAGQGFSAEEYTSSQSATDIVMDDYVAPLIEHAIAFNSVMNLLRARQRDGAGHEGTESLTEGDRSSMKAVLDQMQEKVTDVDEMTLRDHPLAQRSIRLTRKLRDALDNVTYSGSDLYRIFGEVKTELCGLARELDDSGKVTITGLDQIRQLYECQ